MARKKNEIKMAQISLTIPESWKNQLESLARIYSVELNHTISLQEMIRLGLQEKFQLGGIADGQYSDWEESE